MNTSETNNSKNAIPFKAETRQLLNILIHSLYSDREVFLRELLSNASDALSRVNFEMLTNRNIYKPESDLGIWISLNPEENTITIKDSGIGMTENEIVENLGTIAHSGVSAFLEAAQKHEQNVVDLIGQFGVGFYSAFMVAESITVFSRSYQPDVEAVEWISTGEENFTVQSGDKVDRGTEIVIKLKEDATEFCRENRIKEIIRRHSNYIPFPIYLEGNDEQINQQSALWRQQSQDIDEQQYIDFYKQITLDIEDPVTNIHIVIDAPVQLFAVLYIPSSPERNIFSPRKQDGVKLYARKILIQEYCRGLLPGYFRFIEGVADSEDIPLNISRETIQSSRIMAQLKKIITAKVLDSLIKLGDEAPEKYDIFWKSFRSLLKEGIAADQEQIDALYSLLRFNSLREQENLVSLDAYINNMKVDQKKIYYILGDDQKSILHSPHLDAFRQLNYDVLLLTDPFDPFMLLKLKKYKEYDLENVTIEDINLPVDDKDDIGQKDDIQSEEIVILIDNLKAVLENKVVDVIVSKRLTKSPTLLVDIEDSIAPEIQHVYRVLNKEYEIPQKILEINLNNELIKKIKQIAPDTPLFSMIVEQLFENAQLIEGLHPDPSSMIIRMQDIMLAAMDSNG